MHLLYLISVWFHILAAITWIGGILFLVLVVVPWLRAGNQAIAAVFLRDTGIRFRNIGWVCFATVLVTGTFNLWVRGVRFESFTNEAWLGSPFGKTTVIKLLVFTLVLVISAIHDFILGPRATAAIAEDPGSAYSAVLRRRASVLGRLNALLALVLVALGVMLVRGVPS